MNDNIKQDTLNEIHNVLKNFSIKYKSKNQIYNKSDINDLSHDRVSLYLLCDPDIEDNFTLDKIRYVGVTFNPEGRKAQHIWCRNDKRCSNNYKYNWIRKLTRENKKPLFIHLENTWVDNRNEAYENEKLLIEYLKSVGCNKLTNGDSGGLNSKRCSDATRKKMSLSHIGLLKGHKLTEEQKKHLSEINKGKKHTEEAKRKMALFQSNRKRKITHKGTPVYQLDLKENVIKEWESIRLAARELNIERANIMKICKNPGNKKYQTAGGFKWKYKETFTTINS